MPNIQSISYQYRTLRGILPYAYGSSIPRVLYSRIHFLFTGSTSTLKDINERSMQWISIHSEVIITAHKDKKTDTFIIQLPFQKISLAEAIQEGYITLKYHCKNSDPVVSIRNVSINYINYKHLFLDLSRELLLTITVGATKQILDLLNLGFNRTIALQCALVLGLVKGLSKSVSDHIIYHKKVTLTKMISKCLIDIFSELATVLFIDFLHQSPSPAYKSAIKGVFKYLFKHCCQRYLILMTAFKLSPQMFKFIFKAILNNHIYAIFGPFITMNELFLETFKASFKGYLRAYGYSILGQFVGPMIGSIFGATLINIFIDQCTLASKYH